MYDVYVKYELYVNMPFAKYDLYVKYDAFYVRNGRFMPLSPTDRHGYYNYL